MRVHWMILAAAIGLLVTYAGFGATERSARDIVDEGMARRVATLYMHHYLSLCGEAQQPVSRGRYWYVPLRMGQGAELFESVRIDTHTGTVTYRGRLYRTDKRRQHETTTLTELEKWAGTPL